MPYLQPPHVALFGFIYIYVYIYLSHTSPSIHPLTLFYRSFHICFLRLALGNKKIKPSATCTKDFFEENEPKFTELEGKKL